MEKERGTFRGSIGFVLAAAGSAVGLGNIWRFPYLAARDGGGLFLVVYLVLAVTFGFSLLLTEVSIGRKTKQSPLTACCREYTGQEPMHTISWTQTARLGEIMVREFEPVRELSCSVILLNDGRSTDDEDILDKSCSIARTACEYLTSNGVVVDLYTNYAVSGYGRKITRTVRAGKENLRDILAMLGALLAKDSGSVRNLIDASCRGAAESTGFLIIAPRPSKEADDLGLALRQRSAGPIKVIYVNDAAGSNDAGAAGTGGGAAC